MATDVELPQLGESVTEGTVTAWLVEVGDTVEVDQPLFELSSDKIDTEVPSPAAGTITEILVQVDETVEVGTVVARIGDADEATSEGGGDEDTDESADQQGAEEQGGDGGGEDELHGGQDEGGAAEGPEPAAEPEAGADAPESDSAGGEHGGGGDGAGGDAGGGGEATDVVLPELGESVTEGTVTAWLVEVGDTVEVDQPLFELSSDKIDTEVPSPAAGTISEILVDVDETVEVGTVVARIGGGGGGGGAQAPAEEEDTSGGDDQEATEAASDQPSESSAAGQDDADDAPSGPTGSDALASPLVRNLAREHDVDLDQVSGSGKGGRITREDIQQHIDGGGAERAAEPAKPKTAEKAGKQEKPEKAAQKPSAPSEPRAAGDRERVEDLSRIRQRIAAKMLESQREAAQLTTIQEVDVTAMMTARAAHKDEFKQREGVSLSPFAMVARAALMAVRNHPMINAQADWENGKLYLRDYVNLGIAVDTPKGLLVPNVKGADGLTTAGLARGIAEAAQKARGEGNRKLDFADIEGGTFTLTNTGSVGVLMDTPILNHPEVAILGVGAIRRRPAVITGADGSEAIAIRDLMYLSLTYDHRLLDGADAARFVTEVKTVCESTDWEQEIA